MPAARIRAKGGISAPALALLLSLLGTRCGRFETAPGPPDVVLVTLDTTRADRLGCYGHRRIETPHLDRLASEGVRFERAFTPVPSTLPSHASILTGSYPAQHGIHDNAVYRLADGATTLAERLSEHGYRTAAFVSAFVLERRFGLAQGFDLYDDAVELPLSERSARNSERSPELSAGTRSWLRRQTEPYQRRADAVTRAAIEWLRTAGNPPSFLWIHYFDPHLPYQPPAPWDSRYDPSYRGTLDGRMETFLRLARERGWRAPQEIPAPHLEHMIALHDGEVSFMDEWIGRLFAELRRSGRWEESLVVVVGDHGEGFGEHGQLWEHNGQIFDEVLRVPLIVKGPGIGPPGAVDSRLVSTLDVAPTILHLLGIDGLAEAAGVPLFPPATDRATPEPRHLLLEALRERQAVAMPHSWLGLRGARWKLILHLGAGDEVLRSGFYDLDADPGEGQSRHEAYPGRTARWRERTLAWYRQLRSEAGGEAAGAIDPTTRRALEALGYLQ